MRVIARLNIGGPAYHVSLLSGRLDPERYETLLVAGRPGPGEGSFEDLARHYGARMTLLPSLSPAIDPRARTAAGVRDDEVVALYAGRLVPIKKVDLLLRALARARGAGAPLRLVVLGDGDLRPALGLLAGELGIADHVTFAGYR